MKLEAQNNKNWQHLTFNVPIEQSVKSKKDFIIKGVAINSTLTRNGVEFVDDELSLSAASLRNKPILKDHNNSIDSIVGRTTQNVNFNVTNRNVEFEAKIMDESIQEKIDNGLIQSVSVGAMVSDLEEAVDDDGNMTHLIARGIDFVELSLVAVPADPGAGLRQAIQQSFNLKMQSETSDKVEEVTSNESDLEGTQVEDTEKMENLEKIQKENEELKAKLSQIEEKAKFEAEVDKRVAEKMAELEPKVEADTTEAVQEVEEKVDETQGTVGDTVEESAEEDNLVILREGKGYSMHMKSYDSKYNKLSRGQ